jgi:hypothetical protein
MGWRMPRRNFEAALGACGGEQGKGDHPGHGANNERPDGRAIGTRIGTRLHGTGQHEAG